MSNHPRARMLLEKVHKTAEQLGATYVCVLHLPREELADIASNMRRKDAVAQLRELADRLEAGPDKTHAPLGG